MARKAHVWGGWLWTVAVLAGLAALGTIAVVAILRPKVTITEAVSAPVVQAFYSTGTVQPVREYPIKSNTAGTITSMLVDKGSHVKQGEPIAVVTDPAQRYELQRSQAELDEKVRRGDPATSPVLQEFDAKISANNDLVDISKREVDRLNGMMAHAAGSQADLDHAMDRYKTYFSDLQSMKAERETMRLALAKDIDVARAAVQTAQWNVDQQTLKAPIDGVVLDRPTSLGTRVAINDPLMRIADISPKNLVLRAAVDEEDVAKVRLGQSVRVSLYAFENVTMLGSVEQIYDQADPERRTFEVDVRLNDPNDRLSPGMTGELAFIMAERSAGVVVPSQAVQGGAVYSAREGRVHRNEVKVGIRSVERAEIVSGIAAGEAVVISPCSDLSDGEQVRTERVDPATAAGLNKAPDAGDGFKGFNSSQ